jgi:hypothetical protein
MFDRGHFPGLKRPGCEAENWPPSTTKVKLDKVIPPLPHTPYRFLKYMKTNNCNLVMRFSFCQKADLYLLMYKIMLSARVLPPLCSE